MIDSRETRAREGSFISVRRLRGTLFGIGVGDLRTRDDWWMLGRTVGEVVGTADGSRVSLCADLRRAREFPDVGRSYAIERLQRFAARLQRAAILLPEPPAGDEIEDLLERIQCRGRLACHRPVHATAWLVPVLTVPEQAALEAFLASA